MKTFGMILHRPVGWAATVGEAALLRHHLAWCSGHWWARRKGAFAHPTKFRASRGARAVRGCAPASAQGKLDARYEVTLSGIPVGKGSWVVDIADDQYSASASGGTSGLLNAFASGSGTGGSQGRIVNGALLPQVYSATVHSSKKSETIRMSLAAGNIKEFTIDPEPPVDPDRILVTDAHRRGVSDPMTGSLLRVPGTADPVSPEACRAGGAMFDGRMRYELKLDYKRMEHVKAEKGYSGPAVVCAVYFTPVAGYIPDRAAIK